MTTRHGPSRRPPALAELGRRIRLRLITLAVDEAGMSTVEYAIGTLAAAAFGAILYAVVTGDSVVSGLTRLIGRALSTSV